MVPSESRTGTTVVVVSYFTGDVLFRCLESILEQPETARLVLVDNGNDADTLARLTRMAAAQPRLSVLSGHGNIGFGKGCNLGARDAATPHVAFVNPDCALPSGLFAALAREFDDDPDAWMVTPRLIGADGAPERGTPRAILTPWTALVETLGLWRIAPNHPSFQRLNLYATDAYWRAGHVPAVSGAFMFFRLPAWRDLGGFDENYFLHVEDLDLCLQIARRGGRIRYIPSATAVHHRSTSRVSRAFLEWHKTKGARFYMRKNFTGIYPAWAIAGINAMLWLRLAFMLTLGRLRRAK